MDKKRQIIIKGVLISIFLILFISTLTKFNIISFDDNNLPVAISLNKLEIGIKKSDSYGLKATVYPINSFNGVIEWESSNPNIVEVDNEGKVYGKEVGDAYVTAKIPYNNMQVKALIHVLSEDITAESIILSTNEINLFVNDSYDIRYQAYPLNSNINNVYFTSSNQDILEVDNTGYIKAKKKGIAYVNAYTLNGDTKTIKVNILDKIDNNKITISQDKVYLNVGSKIKIKTSNKNVYWESLNPNIAKVENGLIEALNTGNTKVFVKLSNENLIVIDVNVLTDHINLENIEIKEKEIELYVGDTYEITTKITPINATNLNLEYISDNISIASINDGVIKANGIGETKIMVKNANSEIFDTITVNVIENPNRVELEELIFDEDEIVMNIGDSRELNYRIEPINAKPLLNFTSSDNEIVLVDNGVIRALKEGEATVYANEGELSRRVNIKVIDVPLLVITANTTDISITANETYYLKLGFVPNNASDINIQYISEDSSIATVDNGIIKGINNGNTIIKVKSNNVELDINVEVR